MAVLLFLLSCAPPGSSLSSPRLGFKSGKVFGNPETLRRLLDQFEKENPGIRVIEETLSHPRMNRFGFRSPALPLIFFVFACQRRIVEGLTAGAIKG
jgi:hypothetical protein